MEHLMFKDASMVHGSEIGGTKEPWESVSALT